MRIFKTNKMLRAELAVLSKDYDGLQDRYNLLLGRQLEMPDAPQLADLGKLWQEAERHGEIEVDRARDYQRQREIYDVKIKFKTKKGSMIYAKGSGDTIVSAMESAINEARALMAGVVFADA